MLSPVSLQSLGTMSEGNVDESDIKLPRANLTPICEPSVQELHTDIEYPH
jgi:hypothetical protein